MLTCWKLGSADDNSISSKDVIERSCGLNYVFALRLLSAFMLMVTLHNLTQVKEVLVTISLYAHIHIDRGIG